MIQNAAVRRNRDKRRQRVIEAKDRPCQDCGVPYPVAVMHFHHRPGEMKVDTMSNLVRGKGMRAIEDELAKCDVLCANCHTLRHIADGSIGANDPYGPRPLD